MPASSLPSQRKRRSHGAAHPSDGADILQTLVLLGLLRPTQVDPIRQTAKIKSITVEEAIA